MDSVDPSRGEPAQVFTDAAHAYQQGARQETHHIREAPAGTLHKL